MRMKLPTIAVLGLLLLTAAACRHNEQTVTGSYGAGVITGQVTMAGGGSPAGVQVSVGGTGMATTVGEDGRFAFVDAPENATLRFRRAADGIDTSMKVSGQATPVAVVLGDKGSSGRHRAAAASPFSQVDGTVKSATATSLVVTDNHGQDVTLTLTPDTPIRTEHKQLTAADLTPGTRVHVMFTTSNNVNTAMLVVVQENENENEDQHNTATANGVVTSKGTDQIVVHQANGGDVTVKVTSTTSIKKHGTPITLNDINVGDHVESLGTRVDATTITATQIEVESPNNAGKEAEVSGTVSSVGTSSLMVGTTTVNVSGTTRIRKNGQTIGLTDIAVGDKVQAEGTRVDATTINATQIEVEGPEPQHDQKASVSGTVTAVNSSSLVVGSGSSAMTVNVDANTRISNDDATMALSDIHVGDSVKASGTRVDDHTILAAEVEVRGGSGHH